MIPYNDSFKDYMDQLIYDEQNKPDGMKDIKKIERLQLEKETYETQIVTLKDAISSNKEEDITVEDVYKLQSDLMALPHYGKNLSNILGK